MMPHGRNNLHIELLRAVYRERRDRALEFPEGSPSVTILGRGAPGQDVGVGPLVHFGDFTTMHGRFRKHRG